MCDTVTRILDPEQVCVCVRKGNLKARDEGQVGAVAVVVGLLVVSRQYWVGYVLAITIIMAHQLTLYVIMYSSEV